MSVSDEESSLACSINYAVSLFDEATIARLVGMYERVLEAFTQEQTQPISSIEVLSAQERHQLLVEWNATDSDYPRDKTLHALFEAQVATSPEKIALVFDEQELSYAELNRRANQLARCIRQRYEAAYGKRMTADTLIALYLDRSVEMIVSILAVLKAGGAYVPISPEYPQARYTYIMEDSGVDLLLTQQKYQANVVEWGAKLNLSLIHI